MMDNSLSSLALQPCGTSDVKSIGWGSPRGTDAFIHTVNNQMLLALGIEQKLLPASVVKHLANERALTIEAADGRRVGRKEMRDLREAAALELLPRAFIRRSTTFGWIDPVNGWLVLIQLPQPRQRSSWSTCASRLKAFRPSY